MSRARGRTRPSRLRTTLLPLLVVLATGLPIAAAQDQQQPDVRVQNATFVWLDADEFATFEWSVELVSTLSEPQRVRVLLELLDDNDEVVNVDAQGRVTDAVVVTVQPGTTAQVRQRGRIAYDRAADVYTMRHRRELLPPGERSRSGR